ncbi:MAG: DUF3305 domain-containing protein [Kiloniellaceae bacterium]
MDRHERLPLGVVLERRRIDHPWLDYSWAPVAVIPGAPPRDPHGEWSVLRQGEDWIHYHGGTLPLELFRRETEGYKLNLSQEPPRVFVVLRAGEDSDSEHEVVPFLVTACPYEAQDYLDSGEEIVEAVTMPPDVIAFVQAYIDRHHVDEPFRKRKRKRADPQKVGFGQGPPAGPRGGRHG